MSQKEEWESPTLKRLHKLREKNFISHRTMDAEQIIAATAARAERVWKSLSGIKKRRTAAKRKSTLKYSR